MINMIKEIYNVIEVITVIYAFIRLVVWAGRKFKNSFSLTIDEIKKKAKKTVLAKFLTLLKSFIPALLSVVALIIDIYLNRPFDTINFILISSFITLILWNIILVYVFEKIEALEINIIDTSDGLFRLTADLRKAKVELQTSANKAKSNSEKALAYSIESKKYVDKVEEDMKKIEGFAKDASKFEKQIDDIIDALEKSGNLVGKMFGGFPRKNF
jgi:Asp-tRNA(Asn)/Glu-tRNA(Gln) amidotransferase C subunit